MWYAIRMPKVFMVADEPARTPLLASLLVPFMTVQALEYPIMGKGKAY